LFKTRGPPVEKIVEPKKGKRSVKKENPTVYDGFHNKLF